MCAFLGTEQVGDLHTSTRDEGPVKACLESLPDDLSTQPNQHHMKCNERHGLAAAPDHLQIAVLDCQKKTHTKKTNTVECAVDDAMSSPGFNTPKWVACSRRPRMLFQVSILGGVRPV